MKMEYAILMVPGAAMLALLFALFTARKVMKMPEAENTRGIAAIIRKGANAFLKRQYAVVAVFFGCMFLVLGVLALVGFVSPFMPFAFLTGGVFSGLSGFLGMKIATAANARTATAAQHSLNRGLRAAFSAGSVMGMVVVGLGLCDLSIWYFVLKGFYGITETSLTEAAFIATNMITFGMGASSMALFARVGGGIFTKAADVGADLVGKVEADIPEDDHRNPAVIADNVGDNVGDVAGMGADLFDSNVAAMASALVIAQSLSGTGFNNVSMVFCYAILGLFASIIGIATARVGKKGPTSALNSSTYVTTAIYLVLTAIATAVFPGFSWRIWGAAAVGLLVGVIIGITTDYFTDDTKPIVQKVAHASSSGPAFTVLSGISYGFISALPAMVGIAVSALVAYKLCEPMGEGYAIFGISMAAVGMLSIVGMIISNDAYGPIVDNARGLAEMGGLGEETIRTADELDSAGNTVKAVTKGFSISAPAFSWRVRTGALLEKRGHKKSRTSHR